jgi:hypothetical protein
MSKRGTRAALVVLVILVAAVFFFVNRKSNSTIRRELRDFALADTASITKIILTTNQPKQVILTKDEKGTWFVNADYEARPDAIRVLLKTMHDVAIREPVSNRARENVIKQLASGGTKMEAFAGDKLVKAYFVGTETPDMLGTYMLLRDAETDENSTHPFIVEIPGFNGYLTPRYSANLYDWRDKTVFRYYAPDIRSIRVDYMQKTDSSFEVRQTGRSRGFGLFTPTGKPLAFDTLAIKQYISYFNYIAHEGFATEVTKERRDSILASQPINKLTITDAAGKTNQVVLYLKKNNGTAPVDPTAAVPPPYDPDRMYATVNNGKDIVRVQYFVFGKLLQTPNYFLSNKK